MATRMQQRRGTATQWTDADPILASGEIGFETDTNQFKIGDGVNHWSDLSYFKNLEDLGGSLDDYILLTQKGSANGVATLDNTGKIPSSQIPDLVGLDSEIASSVADAIAEEVSDRDAAIAAAISTEVSDRNSAISSAISTEVTNRNTAISNAVSDLESEISTSVADAVDNLVNGAPAALDTLNEIATVIGDSGNIVGSLITNIGGLNTSVANHSDATENVHGITNTAELATHTYVEGEINDATTTLNTTIDNNYAALQGEIVQAVSDHADLTANVHGITNFGDLATKGYADTAVGNHANDTTNVHGIADFADLASQSYADDKADEARTAAEAAAATALEGHTDATTDVHGITDTANLVYTSDSRLSDERTPSAGSVTAAKIASDAVETAKIADNAVTNAKLADNAVDTAEIKDGAVTNAKLAGSIAQSKVTGLESALSSKLDSTTAASTYAPIANPTFTGTVSGVTKAMVGLTNVDNTSDANKPVSSAAQAALDAKLSLAGGTMTGDLTLAGAPTADLHAATKLYVDNVAAGINFHQPVRVATTANITLSGLQTIDGVSLSAGDRVLVKDQSNAKTNGIYEVKNNGWTRTADADNTPTGELAGGDFCLVLEGTVNAGYGYVCSNTSAITIGTTDITYAAFNAAKAVSAGSGLTESTPGTIDIATGGVTSAMIADGTIVNGDINASAAIAQSKIANLTTDLAAKAPTAAPTFTGLVTVSSSGVAFTDGTQTKAGVPSITEFATAISSSATLASGQQDKFVPLTGAVTITLPATGYSTGQSIDFYQESGTGAAFASTNGVVGTPGLKFRTTNSVVTAMKTASGWLVFGDLSA